MSVGSSSHLVKVVKSPEKGQGTFNYGEGTNWVRPVMVISNQRGQKFEVY